MQHKYKFLNAKKQIYYNATTCKMIFLFVYFFLMFKHGTKKNLAIKLFVFLFFCFNFIKLNKKGGV